ncbi:unnamed protein product [Mytilus edulis]|uniref:Uncharacterized protein n=1 Tax=Mytilus edulis TaxID=6550 RepID=A0A8S3RE67_MYTED|nr:unnamed protein product [Mytilus edulis]
MTKKPERHKKMESTWNSTATLPKANNNQGIKRDIAGYLRRNKNTGYNPSQEELNEKQLQTNELYVPPKEKEECLQTVKHHSREETKSTEGSLTTQVVRNRGIIETLTNFFGIGRHVDEVDVELKRRQLFHDIEQMFIGSTLLSHLVIEDQIFVNAKDGLDPEMAKIKELLSNKPSINLLGARNFLNASFL